MTFTEYIKELKKITLQDIKNIINEDLINKKTTLYGFKEQRGFLLFGEFENGRIPKPYVFMCENDDNLCQELYNLLQNEFLNNCTYSYEHDFGGKYEYFGILNDEDLIIYFPSYKPSHQRWIHEQVSLDDQIKRSI